MNRSTVQLYFVVAIFKIYLDNKMLSYRRETVLQGGLIMAQNGTRELGNNIYGHYIGLSSTTVT